MHYFYKQKNSLAVSCGRKKNKNKDNIEERKEKNSRYFLFPLYVSFENNFISSFIDKYMI
jgi:hypothetical protein